MPTYDYRCTNCEYVFEHFQSMFEEPLKICPRCEGEVKRVISGGSGLIFKGSGFYITDYKGKTPGSSASGNGGNKPKKEAKSQAKTESKVK